VLALALLPAAAAADTSAPSAESGAMSEWFRGLWRALPSATNGCQGDDRGVPWFDYGVPGGGMRTFYCYLRARAGGFAELERVAGMPVFLAGPHQGGKLDLQSASSFGHYNPDFVRWLGRAAIPSPGDATFRAATQPIYRARVQPLARIYYVTYVKLHDWPGFLTHEKGALLSRMRSEGKRRPHELGAGWYEKYALFMNPGYFAHANDESWLMEHGFDGGWDCNLVKTAVGFWIRRSIDGTDQLFFADLEQLLRTYDADFLANPRPKG
jgi:hypothetical protein